jgi:cation transport regulator
MCWRETVMPFKTASSLPESVRNVLPLNAQKIYMEVYNHAWQNYASPGKRRDAASREETAARVAWAAVKRKFEKDEKTGQWEEK